MPLMAKPIFIMLAIGWLVGCAQLPSQAHQEVTLEAIQQLINERQPHSQSQLNQVAKACGEQLQQQVDQQSQQLKDLTKQLKLLNSANPSFAQSMCPPAQSNAQYDGKMVVGSLEWVYILQPRHHYKARVDSGATTSSIHAINISRFERDGKKWVSFELQDEDRTKTQKIEAPVVRTASIRQASTEEIIHRPVVRLTLILGNVQQATDFTLTDRGHMDYSVLLGRTFLQDIALIDVGRTMIQPKFEPDEPKVEVEPTQTEPEVKAEPKPAEPKPAEPKLVEPKPAEPKAEAPLETQAENKAETNAESEPKIEPKKVEPKEDSTVKADNDSVVTPETQVIEP